MQESGALIGDWQVICSLLQDSFFNHETFVALSDVFVASCQIRRLKANMLAYLLEILSTIPQFLDDLRSDPTFEDTIFISLGI